MNPEILWTQAAGGRRGERARSGKVLSTESEWRKCLQVSLIRPLNGGALARKGDVHKSMGSYSGLSECWLQHLSEVAVPLMYIRSGVGKETYSCEVKSLQVPVARSENPHIRFWTGAGLLNSNFWKFLVIIFRIFLLPFVLFLLLGL